MLKLLVILGALTMGTAAFGGSPTGSAYDLLFRDGTLDQLGTDRLVYSRAVVNRLKPDAAARDTGEIALSVQPGAQPLATLRFHQDGKHRALGRFPASVGNPMILFFYETVIRDMAEAAGGSPYYIRNRVKDALVQDLAVAHGDAVRAGRTVPTATVTFKPFAQDPNRARMQGFGDLELTVTMSDDVPGWYLSLVAEAGDTYRSAVMFDRQEPAQ